MAKYQITKKDVFSIFKNLVMCYPYSDCKQINTFAVVDSIDDFDTDNLGKVYQDYLSGTFWSRKWFLSGANSNKLSKQYPILAIEQKRISKDIIDSKKVCYEFWSTILDVADCPSCKDQCKRSADQVDCDIQDAALLIQEELMTVGLYEVKFVDEVETKFIWVPSGQIVDWMNPNNPKIEWHELKVEFCDFLDSANINIFSSEIGIKDNARAVTFNFKICTCGPQKERFNYSAKVDPKQIGTAKCDTC